MSNAYKILLGILDVFKGNPGNLVPPPAGMSDEEALMYKIYFYLVKGAADSGGGGDLSYSKISEVAVGGVAVGDTVGPTLSAALDQILSAPFDGLDFNYSINFGLVEKGLSVTPTSTWNVSPDDDTVNNISLFRNNVLESNQGTSLTGSYNHTDPITFSNTQLERTYKIEIDAVTGGLKTASRVVNFVAPTYAGVLDIGDVDEVNIKTLSKFIRNKANQNVTYSPVLQRYVYAYPKSFGTLTSVKDPSNFEVIGSFDLSEITFTLQDGTQEDMYVYVSNADTTQINFELDFRF